MVDFWTLKKQQLQEKGELPSARPEPVSNGPWWQSGSYPSQQENGPQRGLQSHTEASEGQRSDDGKIDGHDVSKAMHVKSSSACPMCQAGGPGKEKLPGMMKATSSSASRCMSCGHVDGRTLNDVALLSGARVPENVAQSVRIRQTDDGGARTDSTHMGGSVADIMHNQAILERSHEGKTTIG